ncbi:MAG: hypothetical protein JKY89_10980 [Immundisolibacteraceae bacterium]|nr:hypothetical protein [Immundisolibacteraceae bacterium]
MSDTPQNDEAISETINEDVNAVIETNDSVPHSEGGEQVQAESNEQVDEVELAKQKSNDAFNKQYGQLKQAERDNDAQASRIAQFEQQERERQAAAIGTIPDMPDSFDDDFDAKMKARDEAIVANANFNAQNNAYLQQQQQSQQQAEQAKAVKTQETIASYSKKATELGIKQDELQAAGNAVANYGLSDDLVMHIIGGDDGPLIVKHLAANPQDGYQLAGMSPYDVGSFLDTIKAKASSLKPKTSNAPAPAANLSGNGAVPDDGYKNIKGAKFY